MVVEVVTEMSHDMVGLSHYFTTVRSINNACCVEACSHPPACNLILSALSRASTAFLHLPIYQTQNLFACHTIPCYVKQRPFAPFCLASGQHLHKASLD